jgi:hypothetical protein
MCADIISRKVEKGLNLTSGSCKEWRGPAARLRTARSEIAPNLPNLGSILNNI